MSTVTLFLSPHDPVIARDGRPFGTGQGNRMHSMGWPLPSVVAGSFRTALVKAAPSLDFSGDMPDRLMKIEVAGVFPVVGKKMYLPAPKDALAESDQDGKGVRTVHRLVPQEYFGGCDFPDDLPLWPVMLSMDQAEQDFKPAELPAWWPMDSVAKWLARDEVQIDDSFLCAPVREMREHVCIDANRGAAAEGLIFTASGLNLTYLPRFSPAGQTLEKNRFDERCVPISLACRATTDDEDFSHLREMNTWHPMGGERRLVHWKAGGAEEDVALWNCPDPLRDAFAEAKRIRMVMATPAIFEKGWLPGWLDEKTLEGKPPFEGAPAMKLIGVINGRWEAVSGWSLAPPRGPKPVRRMVPAGGVYFFELLPGESGFPVDAGWLRPVSDRQQDRNDGFGLTVWGTW